MVEAAVRFEAERDQRLKAADQLAKTESMLREAQRELDRVKRTEAKP